MAFLFEDKSNSRYARQEQIEWWDQTRLSNARIVVAGAGAIGNESLKLLALLGVGSILVVDFDTVSRSNLSRTVLFREEDLGQPKAHLAAERASVLNPEISVTSINGDIGRDLGLAALREADFVLGGLDSINARRQLNRRCLAVGIPWSNAGISESQAQLTRYSPGFGPCYECTLTASARKRALERFSCTGLPRNIPARAMPTTAVAASLIAALQVQDALCFLHDRPSGLSDGSRLTYLLDTHRTMIDALPIDPTCPVHNLLLESRAKLDDGPEKVTAHTIARLAGMDESRVVVHLGFDLVESLICQDCGVEAVGQPAPTIFDEDTYCPRCKSKRVPTTNSQVSLGSPFWNVPLADLGVAPREILVVSQGSEEAQFSVEIGGPDPWAKRSDVSNQRENRYIGDR